MRKDERNVLLEKIRLLEEQNSLLKEKVERLGEANRRAGWQYEYDHADDWRKPVEMGQL